MYMYKHICEHTHTYKRKVKEVEREQPQKRQVIEQVKSYLRTFTLLGCEHLNAGSTVPRGTEKTT